MLLLAALPLAAANPSPVAAADPSPIAAATALLQRVLPTVADQFTLELLPSTGADGRAAMQIDSADGKVVLRGTGAIEIASALNWYCNDYLNITFDWNTYGEGQLPAGALPLPAPKTSPVVPRRVEWSYYMNVCTYGYSLAFVPWSYWERHIDWMALQGVNMPLMFVGQEWLWARTFESFNISFEQQASFYSGAAFLPWFRMGNMRGFAGPLSADWVEKRRDLAVQMLGRMRSLGMKPALGAFAGHVPAAFASKYPSAKLSRSPDWSNFDAGRNDTAAFADVWLLDASDPLFQEVGRTFIALQAATYGTDHIYQADTYNEMSPPTTDPGYLRASSAAVYAAMAAADPQAIWLMQGWLFQSSWWKAPQIEAYLGGVKPGQMWLLDLFGDSNPIWSKTASFYGHPFIFCTLLNFGGQQGIVGNTPRIAQGTQAAVSNSSVNGVGITMEGIWTNYNVFELQLLLGWEAPRAPVGAAFNSTAHAARYGARRYGGQADPSAVGAWELLGASIYSGGGGGFGSAISSVPSLGGSTCSHPPLGPQPPTPEPPAGYERRHPQDGYWAPAPAALVNTSVAECAAKCDAAGAACDAFEVYVHAPPDRGDCYPMSTAGKTFTPLGGGSRTYLKTKTHEPQPAAAVAAPTRLERVSAAAGVRARGADSSLRESLSARQEASVFQRAWDLLLRAAPTHGSVASYRFDLVDVGREVLAANFSATWAAYSDAFAGKDAATTKALSARLLRTIDDYDTLLATDTNFMLGRWLEWARGWGDDDSAKARLEFGARNQLTLWGPTGQINDYAKKEWAGLVKTYYRPRWAKLLGAAQSFLEDGGSKAWSDEMITYCHDVWTTVELPWQTDTTAFPTAPTGDTIEVARSLIGAYRG